MDKAMMTQLLADATGVGPTAAFGVPEDARARTLAPLDRLDLNSVESLRQAARGVARIEVTNAVQDALYAYKTEQIKMGRKGSMRALAEDSGLDVSFISNLANGAVNKQGATVASLAQLALAMNKTLKITIE
ncbi:hypothetical protein [Hwanghaeella sp. LZ110]|uniref:hypothetical protein n=1 Tax=Hwanghaeella sp. LZ110 TaxID=3402810 RepID=UPI003B677F9F